MGWLPGRCQANDRGIDMSTSRRIDPAHPHRLPRGAAFRWLSGCDDPQRLEEDTAIARRSRRGGCFADSDERLHGDAAVFFSRNVDDPTKHLID